MTKRKKLFWTPYATHSVDLLLEDYEKKISIHEETIPKGKKILLYLFKIFSNIFTSTFHKGKRFGTGGYYSLCYISFDIRVPPWE